MRVCSSDFQIKGKHRLHVNFRTGLDIHGIRILIYNLVSKMHAFEIIVTIRRHMYASNVINFYSILSYKHFCLYVLLSIKPL